jgi:hypothetical protein
VEDGIRRGDDSLRLRTLRSEYLWEVALPQDLCKKRLSSEFAYLEKHFISRFM